MEEEESSNTLLREVDIRAAKIKRRLQPVGEIINVLELGDYAYYPSRYLRIIPDILEDILWRVGPLLQHGAFICAMTICCILDLPPNDVTRQR